MQWVHFVKYVDSIGIIFTFANTKKINIARLPSFCAAVVELHGALELWPFLKYGCDSGDLSAGVCWIAGEMEALSHDFDAEIYPMINLTCLPCKDLFAPVELISQRLEEMVLRGECRPLINGTLPHSVRIYR